MKKNNKKFLIIIISLLSLLLIVAGLMINNKNNDNQSLPKDSDNINRILLNLNLDKYINSILYPTVELNRNVLEPNYPYFNMYYYTSSNYSKQKVKIVDKERYIAKYSDYVQFYKNVLSSDVVKNIPSGYEIKQFLSLNPETSMLELNDISAISSCNELNDENCYIIINVINDPQGYVEFASLNKQENVISGDAIKHINYNAKEYKMTAKFEFEYTENNGKKYASSLKILSIEDAFIEK